MNRTRVFILNLALVLASTLISFVVCVGVIEGVTSIGRTDDPRWHGVNTNFDPEIGWVVTPDFVTETEDGTFTTNSDGFRSREIGPNWAQILVLGDSVVWGHSASDDEHFPHYLDEIMRPDDYQGLNLGVSGYGIDQYFLYLKRHIEKL